MRLQKISILILFFCFFYLFYLESIFSQNSKKEVSSKVSIHTSGFNIPALKPNEIWISSIPTGLKAYMVAAEGYVEFDSLCTQKNFKGITPFSIKVAPGHYLIAVERLYPFIKSYSPFGDDTWETLIGLKQEGEYPWFLDKNDIKKEGLSVPIKIMSGIMFDKGKLVGCNLVKLFTMKKEMNLPAKLIALHFLKNTPINNLLNIYPEGQNFTFNEKELRDTLLTKVDEQKIEIILRLLHCGGKIAFYDKKENTIVIEILGNNKWELYEINE